MSLETTRTALERSDLRVGRTHDLPGDTFRLLGKDVAYLKLSSVVAAEAASYMERADGTKGMIIDIRNYPSEHIVLELAP
ncbi:MAG: hypothetical protein ACYTG0_46835 [Planctomycetota bacterium]|jgi:hypothetical protein